MPAEITEQHELNGNSVQGVTPPSLPPIPEDVEPLTVAYITLYQSLLVDHQKQETNMNSIQECIKATKESNARLAQMNFETMDSVREAAKKALANDLANWPTFSILLLAQTVCPDAFIKWLAEEKAAGKDQATIEKDLKGWALANLPDAVDNAVSAAVKNGTWDGKFHYSDCMYFNYEQYIDDATNNFSIKYTEVDSRNQQVVKQRDMENNNISLNQQWEQVAMTDSQATSNSSSQKISMSSAFADILRSVAEKIVFPV